MSLWERRQWRPERRPRPRLLLTIGAANDMVSEGTRRLLVNACYWAVGLEDKIPAKSDVTLVGDYQPSNFKNNGFKKGVRPEDYATESSYPALGRISSIARMTVGNSSG